MSLVKRILLIVAFIFFSILIIEEQISDEGGEYFWGNIFFSIQVICFTVLFIVAMKYGINKEKNKLLKSVIAFRFFLITVSIITIISVVRPELFQSKVKFEAIDEQPNNIQEQLCFKFRNNNKVTIYSCGNDYPYYHTITYSVNKDTLTFGNDLKKYFSGQKRISEKYLIRDSFIFPISLPIGDNANNYINLKITKKS